MLLSHGGRIVRENMSILSERLFKLRELYAELQTGMSVSAITLSGMPKYGQNVRRQESIILKSVEVRSRIAFNERQIKEYIDVLRFLPAKSIREGENKIRILEMRYLTRQEWRCIAAKLYGNDSEYRENTCVRRCHRLHDAACSEIWKYWERVTEDAGKQPKPC